MLRVIPTTIVALAVSLSPISAAPPSDRAIQLRNQGIAELENESPVRAEATFRELAKLVQDDPLPLANLAIASLRQQKFDEARAWIQQALDLAGEEPELLGIVAEIQHWSGDSPGALGTFRRAAAAAPDNVDLQYSLFRQATSSVEPQAAEAAKSALARLARLRPENLVVMLQLGQHARKAGDRAATTAIYLRIAELVWQAPRGADALLERILDGLEANELESLRSSALRLENVLKVTPMYKEGLRELSSGIQGIPLTRFRSEPQIESWGEGADVVFRGRRYAGASDAGAAVVVGDLDGDESVEIARLVTGDAPRLELHASESREASPRRSVAKPGLDKLLLIDLDNDGRQDLLGYGSGGVQLWTIGEDGSANDATAAFGLDSVTANAAAAVDFDIEGDLDIALGSRTVSLLRNSLEGPLEDVTDKSLPSLDLSSIRDIRATDLDRDGDLDLLIAHQSGLAWLDNLRQGRFSDRPTGLPALAGIRRIVSADLDNDGLPDVVIAGEGLTVFRNTGDGLRAAPRRGLPTDAVVDDLLAFDADNDGRLDLAAAGPGGLTVMLQRDQGFASVPVDEAPKHVTALTAADLDNDGDLDLLAEGSDGLVLLENNGGNRNHHLSIKLRGLNKGNSKNNFFGVGSVVEVKAGAAYQFRESAGGPVHFGLGSVAAPDLMRVVWPNGVPQNRLQPETNQRIVEEQLLKGSCPFLYADFGDGFEFVTDLLWGAPIGLPAGEGRYLGADPSELVLIGETDSRGSAYEIRITEELWEAAFFDSVRLWVVDHPSETEVASSLRVQPGEAVPEQVLASRSVRPLAAAWDASGRNVTARVRTRDEIYADGWARSAYQGLAAELWSFTIDLGETPERPIRLLLDGWIFPTDASLNLALDQRSGDHPQPPRLEMETGAGWEPLMPSMGFPAGKTKTMVVDTPALPAGVRRLRIVSSQWLSWDRIAWTDRTADDDAMVVARLEPRNAELRFRGFSAPVRQAPNAPHTFDYSRVTETSPWLPFPGRYTRFGDVRELLLEIDDRSVILGPGDEMAVVFDTSSLPSLRPGTARTLFLESHGWDKDADRNTGRGTEVDPLPFHAMSGYPYPASESFPDSALNRDYLENWLTRIVEGTEALPPPAAP